MLFSGLRNSWKYIFYWIFVIFLRYLKLFIKKNAIFLALMATKMLKQFGKLDEENKEKFDELAKY